MNTHRVEKTSSQIKMGTGEKCEELFERRVEQRATHWTTTAARITVGAVAANDWKEYNNR